MIAPAEDMPRNEAPDIPRRASGPNGFPRSQAARVPFAGPSGVRSAATDTRLETLCVGRAGLQECPRPQEQANENRFHVLVALFEIRGVFRVEFDRRRFDKLPPACDGPASWLDPITSSVVSGSARNVSISSRWPRRRRSISAVEQLPSASQMTFGGAPYRAERALKSPSFDTTVEPRSLAYAHTAESSAAARPTSRT